LRRAGVRELPVEPLGVECAPLPALERETAVTAGYPLRGSWEERGGR